jgi:lipoprotein-anchoring transpeptidase ErfK/SrfK
MKAISLTVFAALSFSAYGLPIAPLAQSSDSMIEKASTAGLAPQFWMVQAQDTAAMEPAINEDDLEEGIADEESAEYDYQEWIWSQAAANPTMFMENVDAKDKAKLVVEVVKSNQTAKVWLNGKILIAPFKVSTGKRGSETPVGTFKPGARKVNWLSQFATRQYGRPIYLKWAVQIHNGAFMHAASAGAMHYLGQKRSSACVRVPPRIAARVYKLVNEHQGHAVFYVH